MIFMEIQLTLPTTPAESKYAKDFDRSDFWLSNQTDGTVTAEFKHTNDLKLVNDIKLKRKQLYRKLNYMYSKMESPETPRKSTRNGNKTPEDLSTESRKLADILVCITTFKYFNCLILLNMLIDRKTKRRDINSNRKWLRFIIWRFQN